MYRLFQQREMRAAENQRSHSLFVHVLNVLFRGKPRNLVVKPPLLRKRDKNRRMTLDHAGFRHDRPDRLDIRTALHRRARGDNPNSAVDRRGARSSGPGLDHPDHGNVVFASQNVESRGRRGVARDHDHLDAPRFEIFGNLPRIVHDRVNGPRSIGEAARIAEIYEPLTGQNVADGLAHSKPADPGVEYAYGIGAHCSDSFRPSDLRNSMYSMPSTSACHDASMIFADTPTVPQ